SPIACAEAVHAVQVARLGPRALKRIDTWPAARLMMEAGMKKGEMRRGPPFMSSTCSRSIVWKPPIPEAMNTPTESAIAGVTSSRASSTANCEAASANWMKTSIFLTSFLSTNCSGSKSLTSPAIRAEYCDGSKRVIGPMPLLPARMASQFACVPMASGDTSPTPVTTTRLLNQPPRLLLLAVRLDVLDGLLDARDLLGVLVRDLDPELLFERHHELDGVERVGPQVIHEGRVRR